MVKKGFSVWLFSSLAFVAILHVIDAVSAIVFANPIRLFQLYPFVGDKLQAITPSVYFWLSIASTLVLWGITCAITFENPMETFLNNILSDAKAQSSTEDSLLEKKSEVLDAMFETIESGNGTLAQVKDLIYNVRTDVREIQSLKENIEKIRTDMISFKKEFKKIEERVRFPNSCPSCGKPLLPDFKLCPYCGENIKLLPKEIIAMEDYR